MSYRDDYEALLERTSALEREVQDLREENARLRAELAGEKPPPRPSSSQKPGDDPVERLFQEYLVSIEAMRGDGIADEELMRDVEGAHGIHGEESERLRTKLLNYKGALAIEGKPLLCGVQFPDLYAAIASLVARR